MRAALFLFLMSGTAWAQAPGVTITHAWARATLPHQDAGVAYFTMTSAAGDTLTGIETPAAGMAMLHATLEKSGVSEMRDVDSITLLPNEPVSLKPNGLHVMLMSMKQALKAGDTLHMTLNFQKAGAMQVDVPVLPVGAAPPP